MPHILAGGGDVLTEQYAMLYFPGDDLFAATAAARGLPIGNLTSQIWGNVCRTTWTNSSSRSYGAGRICATATISCCSPTKGHLQAWRNAVRERLAELRLTLHAERAQVFPVTAGFPWLGFRVFPDHRRLKRENVKAFAHRLRQQRAAYRAGEISLGEIRQSLQAWIAHASHADTYQLRRSLFKRVIF